MSIRFRYDVLSTDSDRVRQLVAATGFFRPDECDIAVELVDARLKDGVSSGYEFVFLEEETKVVGYACYGPIGCTVGSYDLYWIVVDPAIQGRGYGRQLIHEVEKQVHSCQGRRIYIETSDKPQYHPTREFYLRCGYQKASLLADFYDDGDDKLTLVKDLRTR